MQMTVIITVIKNLNNKKNYYTLINYKPVNK